MSYIGKLSGGRVSGPRRFWSAALVSLPIALLVVTAAIAGNGADRVQTETNSKETVMKLRIAIQRKLMDTHPSTV